MLPPPMIPPGQEAEFREASLVGTAVGLAVFVALAYVARWLGLV